MPLVFIFKMYMTNKRKVTRMVRCLGTVSLGLSVLEKTQGHVVTFFKWLKDPPMANGEVWFCVP